MQAVSTGYWVGLSAALLASAAMAQSTWQVQTINPTAGLLVPPALIFDSQNRAQVVYDGGEANLSHLGASGSGPAPTWNLPLDTGISMSGNYGQTYLAVTGGLLYGVYRPYSSSPPTSARSRVFDGNNWAAHTFPVSNVNVYGVVVDGSGTLLWVVNTDGATLQAPITKAGYHVVSRDGTGMVTAVPLALGIGGMEFAGGIDRVLHHGGQTVLNKYGSLHTIQSYEGTGMLLYARGGLTGPFSVTDNFDMSWRAKLGRPSIAADAAGMPHVVYAQGWPYYGLKHLVWTGSSWTGEWVETGGSVYGFLGIFPQVLVDRTGVLHVVYSDLFNSVIKHAAKTQGGWQVEIIEAISTNTTQGAMPRSLGRSLGQPRRHRRGLPRRCRRVEVRVPGAAGRRAARVLRFRRRMAV